MTDRSRDMIHIVTNETRTKVTQTTDYAILLPTGSMLPLAQSELLTFEWAERVVTDAVKGRLIPPGSVLVTRAVFRSQWTEVPA